MIRVDDLANGTSIDARVGQSVEVRLQETPSTGYRWKLEQTGAPVCALSSDSFAPGLGKPGSPGTHSWTFRVDSEGAAAIRLTCRRAWEKEESPRTFILTVRGTQS